MNFSRILLGMFFIFIFEVSLFGQNNWALQKEKDGIKISSRKAAESQFNDIRVELDLPGNIDQLAEILLDIPRYTEWAYATKKSVLIKKLGPGKLIYYSEIEVPWPATNRYFYAQFEIKKDPVDRSLVLVSVNLPDYEPATKDLVKVPYSKGAWKVTTLSINTIHIDYILQLNPGGSLPAWVINLFTTRGPLETFENIKHKMTVLNPG
jgi:START domain